MVNSSGDVHQVIVELFFFDDEEVILIGFDQPQVVKPLHEQADPRPRRAHHRRQFLMGNSQFDANAARVLLAHGSGQLQ